MSDIKGEWVYFSKSKKLVNVDRDAVVAPNEKQIGHADYFAEFFIKQNADNLINLYFPLIEKIIKISRENRKDTINDKHERAEVNRFLYSGYATSYNLKKVFSKNTFELPSFYGTFESLMYASSARDEIENEYEKRLETLFQGESASILNSIIYGRMDEEQLQIWCMKKTDLITVRYKNIFEMLHYNKSNLIECIETIINHFNGNIFDPENLETRIEVHLMSNKRNPMVTKFGDLIGDTHNPYNNQNLSQAYMKTNPLSKAGSDLKQHLRDTWRNRTSEANLNLKDFFK